MQKKIPPALPARGNSTITTVAPSPPQNPNTVHTKTIGTGENSSSSEISSKPNSDSSQPPREDTVVNEVTKIDVNSDKTQNSTTSEDTTSATEKKIYETDMI